MSTRRRQRAGLGAGFRARPGRHRRHRREGDRRRRQHLDLADRRGQGWRRRRSQARRRNCRRARRSRNSSTTSSRTAAAAGRPKGGERTRVAAAQDQFARLRFHHRYRRHRRHQQSRHRGCRRDQRHHERRHQDQGRTGRRRQEDRPRGAEVQAGEAAGRGQVRRFRQAASRRMGDRDRQSRSASAAR